MTQKTLVEVQGIVVELKGTKTGVSNGRSWKRYDFTVQKLNGQTANCNTFGTFDKDLIGSTVEFEAEFNERYSSYSVKGDITVTEGAAPEAPVDPSPAPKRRGRPKKNGTSKVAPVKVQQRTVESDLESVREATNAVFETDLEAVNSRLGKYTDEVLSQALAVGVQAYQAIRATLFIEANKRERVSAMHGR